MSDHSHLFTELTDYLGKVTLNLLQTAKELNVPSLWLQPGADDADVRKFIEENGLAEKVLLGGPCILRDGDFIRSGTGEDEAQAASGRL